MLPSRIKLTITEGVLKGEEYGFHDVAQWVVGRAPDCDIALAMDLLAPPLLVRDRPANGSSARPR
jgi:hypothetical protein